VLSIVSPQRLVAACLLLILLTSIVPSVASAHERRVVGKYALVVGFNNEPTYQGERNGAQITLTVPSEENRPVEGLAETLHVTVAVGSGQSKEFKLHSVFGRQGQYVADFIPTRAGTYIFHFTGTIEGNQIDEHFESGPGRFDDVQGIDQIQFPDVIPLSNDVARAARSAEDSAAYAQATAENVKGMTIASLGVGTLGLVFGIVGVSIALMSRRPRTSGASPEK
jgi:hypothetical protein